MTATTQTKTTPELRIRFAPKEAGMYELEYIARSMDGEEMKGGTYCQDELDLLAVIVTSLQDMNRERLMTEPIRRYTFGD